MTTSPEPPPVKGASPDELEADIERTRAELGATVDALAEKLDVKAQARNKVRDIKSGAEQRSRSVRASGEQAARRAKDAATDEHGSIKPAVPAGAALVAAIVLAVVIWRSRR